MSSSSAPGQSATSVDSAEHRRVLIEWNATAMPYPREACLHELFEQQVDRTPQRVAVACGSRQWTYRQLESRANQVARYLRALGVQAGQLVGICVERDLEMVAGVLGILKAGAAYVPLDPAFPPNRLALMLEDSQAPVVLSQQSLRGILPEGVAQIVELDFDSPSLAQQEASRLGKTATADDRAYVIYTSGSTGRPKGVEIGHRSVANFLTSMARAPGIGADDRLLAVTTLSFDIHVLELYLPLLYGAQVVVAPRSMVTDGNRLIEALASGVTIMQATPATWRLLIEGGWQGTPKLKALCGGEAMHGELAKALLERVDSLWNLYGPTETTVWSTVYEVTQPETGIVSIGRPIGNTTIYLLDEQRQPVPVGEPGELCIGGDGLAHGYFGRPELTAERFVPDPFRDEPGARMYRTGDLARWLSDGRLAYLGRMDHQVKIRGFRIELGEIEAVLLRHPDVAQCAVVARDDGSGNQHLVAYLVAVSQGEAPDRRALREHLRQSLPDYMIPAAFVLLDALPLTPNGKVDRKALPAPDGSRDALEQEYVEPRDALERFLAETWQEVLKRDRVGIADNFFELGGDSIRAAAVINRLQKKLDEFLYVVALFDAPTIADYAEFLKGRHPASVERAFGLKLTTDAQPSAESRTVVDEAALKAFRQLIALRDSEIEPPRSTGKIPPVMFILCAPRSGSTLLRVMLAGNPALFSPPELELLGYETLQQRKRILAGRHSHWLEGTIRAIKELKQCDADEAKRIMADYEDRGLSTQDFYRELQRWVDGRMIVDKSTTYAIHLETLERAERFFDGAYYLYLTRHPAGMVKSFESVNIDQIFLRYEHNYPARELGELIWHTCNKNIVDFLTGVPAERQFHLRYEDLVQQPEGMMRSISDLLGLEFHPDMVTPYRDKEKKMTDGLHSVSIMLGDMKFHTHQGIDPKLATRWQEAQIELGRPTWELAQHLGYEPPAEALRPVPAGSDDADRDRSSPAADGDVTARIAALERELAELKQRQSAEQRVPTPGGAARVAPVSREGHLPLSFQQQRIWERQQADPTSCAYNRVHGIRIAGPLDEAALRRALDGLAERHEILRTTFGEDAGRVGQQIAPRHSIPLRMVERAAASAEEQERALQAEVRREVGQPFDLAAQPPVRATLIRFDERTHVLLRTSHQAVTDCRSNVILATELAALYEAQVLGAEASLPSLPLQYADFAAWQCEALAGSACEDEFGFWCKTLEGASGTLEIPTDHPRPARQTFNGARRFGKLPQGVSERVASLAQRENCTPFMALFAAFSLLLQRRTGQDDLLIGTTSDCRAQLQLENVVGLIADTLPVRAKVGGSGTFRDLLRQIRGSLLSAYEHSLVPFEALVERVGPRGDGSRPPLVQVSFVQQALDTAAPMASAGAAFEPVDLDFSRSMLDLSLLVRKAPDGFALAIQYNADLFEAETIDRWLADFEATLAAVLAEPDRPLATLDLSDEAQRRRLADYKEGRSVEAAASVLARPHPSRHVAPRDDVERFLVDAWCQVLEHEPIGVRDDFFHLGGDSLKAMRLVAQIEKRYAKRLPIATFFEARTVEQIARLLNGAAGNLARGTVVPIRTTGHKRPFFCVSALSVLMFEGLADRLPDRPFYGCQAPGFEGECEPLESVAEIAAEHVRGLRQIQPRGPYFLGGQCFGGLVAYEMAQQLIAAGEEVPLLVLMDSSVPLPMGATMQRINRTRLGRRLRIHLEALAIRSTGQRLAYLGRLGRLFGERVARSLMGKKPPKRQREQSEVLVREANQVAASRYRPQPFPGRIVHFVQQELPIVSQRDRRARWQELAQGGVEIVQMPGGDHLDMFRRQYVPFLAEQLEQRLDANE